MYRLITSISILFFMTTVVYSQQLKSYESFAHFDVEKYIKQYERNFDTNGIITQKKEYHALTICIYGIMNFDAFQETGDSIYYKRIVNQYKYFIDTSKLVFYDEHQRAGLPYNFAFKGLKAPWFSGMTQGVAASFLLRYYALTNDKQALNLSKQIIRFMLQSESDGGTIGRTKEGELWIEEYPNLAASKSVLNGFINGLIGLKEYCTYFPEDQLAASIHDSCYAAMFHSLDAYNTASWTCYSRNSGPITNSYMRYELEEFDHLFSIYGDERLRDQMRIWAKFSVGKFDTELKFLKRPKYDFAADLPYDKNIDGCSYNQYELFSKSMTNGITKHSGRKKSKYDLEKESYYCELRMTDQLLKTTQPQLVAFHNGKKVELTTEIKDGCLSVSSSTPFDAINVRFKHKPPVDSSGVKLMVYDYRNSDIPQFACYTISKKEYLTKGEVVHFTGNPINATGAKVYYRFGKKQDVVKDSKYSIEQSFDFETGSFIVQETGIYEFFVSYDITHPVSQIGQLKIIHQ